MVIIQILDGLYRVALFVLGEEERVPAREFNSKDGTKVFLVGLLKADYFVLYLHGMALEHRKV
jgi:hypothetical protein